MSALCLLLVAALPAPYEWTVAAGGGSPDHVLLFLERNPPPPRRVVATWTLALGEPSADGQTPARLTVREGPKPVTVTDLVLWAEGGQWLFRPKAEATAKPQPAVVRRAPPRVLTTERVPCSAPILGGYVGLCAGRSGGPLGAPEFPFTLTLDPGSPNRALLESMVVTVVTAGVVIPGMRDTSVIASLRPRLRPAALPPELARWSKGLPSVGGLPEALDVETAGALLVLSGKPTAALVAALASRVPALDRWPLVRLARQLGLPPAGVLGAVARFVSEPAPDGPLLASVVEGLEPLAARGVAELAAGRAPGLRALAAQFEAKGFEAAVVKQLGAGDLSPAEAGAATMLLPAPARRKALPQLLAALTLDDGAQLVALDLRPLPPWEAEAALKKLPAWVDRMVAAGRARDAVAVLPFDEGRAKVLIAALERTPEAARRAPLVAALGAFAFDPERERVFVRFKQSLAGLTAGEAHEAFSAFRSTETRLKAFTSLQAWVQPDQRGALLVSAVRSTPHDRDRLDLLKAVPDDALTLSVASDLWLASTFDGDRAEVGCHLVARLAPAAQGPFVTFAVPRFSFADGKLQLLACAGPAVARLSRAERAMLLETFTSFERARAEPLLGR